MNTVRLSIIVALSMLLIAAQLPAEDVEIDWGNRFSAQFSYRGSDDYSRWMADLGWKPELFAEYPFEQDWRLSAEVSLDNHLSYLYVTQANELDWGIELYRAWTALSYKDTELKAGLQHIRFGPAQIIRPLQWFDNLVPGSFHQDSQGVKALTLTHFFPNPELRLWAMPGYGKIKGTEEFATKVSTVEFGGRISGLSKLGETALNFNHRVLKHGYDDNFDAQEYRIGIDLRVDGFMGSWVEGDVNYLPKAVVREAEEGYQLNMEGPWYNGSATLGGDYTLGVGSGLYVLAEVNYHWSVIKKEIIPCSKIEPTFSEAWQGALLLSYPLGILDSIQLIADVHPFSNSPVCPSITLSWRRAYDKLSWDLSLGYTTYGTSLSRANTGTASFTINYDM